MPRSSVLRLYGSPSSQDPLAWEWVAGQLSAAGTYWLVAAGAGPPHPRPVWGVWVDEVLHLSIGSPALAAQIRPGSVPVTAHLESGTDVVIIEGAAALPTQTASEVVAAYERKYGRAYDIDEFGALTLVSPTTVLAWRAAGWAGSESFTATGRWTF